MTWADAFALVGVLAGVTGCVGAVCWFIVKMEGE